MRVDMHRADILAALRKTPKRWTLRRLSLANHLHATAVEKALARPWPRVERIIADALGVEPQEIWPSRYLPDGTPRGRRQRREHRASMGQPDRARPSDTCNGTPPGRGHNSNAGPGLCHAVGSGAAHAAAAA